MDIMIQIIYLGKQITVNLMQNLEIIKAPESIQILEFLRTHLLEYIIKIIID